MLSPASAPLNCRTHNSDGEQEQQGTDGRIDNRCGQFRSERDVQLRQEPVAGEPSGNSYDKVPENSEPYSFYKVTDQPSRDGTDCNYDNQVFAGHLHRYVPTIGTTLCRPGGRAL